MEEFQVLVLSAEGYVIPLTLAVDATVWDLRQQLHATGFSLSVDNTALFLNESLLVNNQALLSTLCKNHATVLATNVPSVVKQRVVSETNTNKSNDPTQLKELEALKNTLTHQHTFFWHQRDYALAHKIDCALFLANDPKDLPWLQALEKELDEIFTEMRHRQWLAFSRLQCCEWPTTCQAAKNMQLVHYDAETEQTFAKNVAEETHVFLKEEHVMDWRLPFTHCFVHERWLVFCSSHYLIAWHLDLRIEKRIGVQKQDPGVNLKSVCSGGKQGLFLVYTNYYDRTSVLSILNPFTQTVSVADVSLPNNTTTVNGASISNAFLDIHHGFYNVCDGTTVSFESRVRSYFPCSNRIFCDNFVFIIERYNAIRYGQKIVLGIYCFNERTRSFENPQTHPLPIQ